VYISQRLNSTGDCNLENQATVRAAARGFLAPAALITALWAATHLFSLSWGLPSQSCPEPDGISLFLSYGVNEQLNYQHHGYPPLQHLLRDIFIKREKEPENIPSETLAELRSAKLVKTRALTAVMALGGALITAFAVALLTKSRTGSVVAGALFILTPVSLWYSLTVNVDQPYVFWWLCAVMCWLLSCQREKYDWRGRALDAATGVFMGLSAASKDQLYAVWALPGLFYLLWLWRSRGFKRCAGTAALWGIFAFAAWSLVWLPCGGVEEVKRHLASLLSTGNRRTPDASGGIFERIRLAGLNLSDLLRAFDWPAVCFFAVCAAGFFTPGKEGVTNRGRKREFVKQAMIFTGLTALSIELLFFQVTRESFPRYWLPLVPPVCFAAGVMFSEIRAFSLLLRALAAAAAFLTVFAAAQLLVSMANDTRAVLREAVREINSRPGAEITAVEGLEPGKRFAALGSEIKEKLCFRDWTGHEFGLYGENVRGIMVNDFCLGVLDPGLLVARGGAPAAERALLERRGYSAAELISPAAPALPVFFRHGCPSYELFIKDKGAAGAEAAEARPEGNFNERLMLAGACLLPAASEKQLAAAGRALGSFEEPDTEKYHIRPPEMLAAGAAYVAAGRLEDASKLYLSSLKNFSDSELSKAALRFFIANPDLALARKLRISREPDGAFRWSFDENRTDAPPASGQP
jgi:hypothetical protein